MTRGHTHTDPTSGEEYSYRDHTDLDTQVGGTDAPFLDWEGDHTALVHVLWSLRNSGLIAGRPERDEPLRQALFDRLHGPVLDRGREENLIADLRAILDSHDPKVTPGAAGSRRLTRDEVKALGPEPSPRQGGDSLGLAASVIGHSRAIAARTAQAIARELRAVATDIETSTGPHPVVDRLRSRARHLLTGKEPTS